MSCPPFATNSRCRRLITAVALLAYVFTVVGYPLPLTAGVEQDASELFPCLGHACGCQTAAQCWDSCCCHSAAERLAWARQNQVALSGPTVARLEAEAEAEKGESDASCCDHDGCCDAKAPARKADGGFAWINGIQAQKCQGLTTLWLVSGANLPLEIRALWEFEWTLVGETSALNEVPISLHRRPEIPPPRR